MGLHTSMLKAQVQYLLVGELQSHKQSSRAKKKPFGGKHLCDPGVHKNSANRTEKALTIGKKMDKLDIH